MRTIPPSQRSPITISITPQTAPSGRIISSVSLTGYVSRRRSAQSAGLQWASTVIKLIVPIITWPYSTAHPKGLKGPSKGYGQSLKASLDSRNVAISRLNPFLISPDTASKRWEEMTLAWRADTLSSIGEVNTRLSVRPELRPSLIRYTHGPAQPPWLSRAMYLQTLGIKAEHIPYPTIGVNICVRNLVYRAIRIHRPGRWTFLGFYRS